MKHSRRQFRQYWAVILAGTVLLALAIIPIRLTIAARQAPQPEAIFVLGGDPGREIAAAELAKYYPDLKIWVSTGQSPEQAKEIFRSIGVAENRLNLDYRATDTVTNFTTLVSEFKQQQIQHVFLVTSDFHMPRAKAVATIVLGSQGITFTPITVPSTRPKESWIRIVRDTGRSFLWIATRRTGAGVGQKLEDRLPELSRFAPIFDKNK